MRKQTRIPKRFMVDFMMVEGLSIVVEPLEGFRGLDSNNYAIGDRGTPIN